MSRATPLEVGANYLEKNADSLVSSWIVWVRERVQTDTIKSLPERALRNHVPPVLLGLANYLRSPVELVREELLGHLRTHGQLRLDQGYTLEEVMAEFSGLSEIVTMGVNRAISRRASEASSEEVLEAATRLASGLRSISYLAMATYARWANEREQATSATLEEFAQAICHEMRNPLNTISLGLQVLESSEIKPQDIEHQLSVMGAAVLRSTQMLDTIRSLSLTEGARAGSRLMTLHDALSRVVKEFSADASATQVEVRVDYNNLPNVHIEAVLLYFILVNTVGNALKYCDETKSKRWVSIEAYLEKEEHDAGFCKIVVEDNGIGIPDELVSRVMQKSFRAHPQHSHGTGMGLYIVSEAVSSRGGTIEIETREGKGTRVAMRVRCMHDSYSTLTPDQFQVAYLMGEAAWTELATWPELPDEA